jgi:hypothetical protein
MTYPASGIPNSTGSAWGTSYTTTGSGTVVALQTSPTFVTGITSPLLIGGTGTTSSLTYKTTTGVGTTGADHIFQVGNNGATEAMRISNSGYVGVGSTATAGAEGSIFRIAKDNTVAGGGQVIITGATDPNKQLIFGYHTSSNYGQIQAIFQGNSTSPFYINPAGGGNVGVGAASASYMLDVTGTLRNTTSAYFATSSGNVGIGTTSPNSTLHNNGSFATAYIAKTANYTLTSSDYLVEVTSGTVTETLPTAVGITGRIYVITNSGSGVVTLGTTSSQTFANVVATPTTLTLNQFATVTVISNGANWLRITSL